MRWVYAYAANESTRRIYGACRPRQPWKFCRCLKTWEPRPCLKTNVHGLRWCVVCWRCHLTFSIRKLLFFSASWSCHVTPKCATCSKISSSKYSDKTHNNTLFSLNFASTKFRDFRNFFKIAKFNTREILDTRRLKFNTIQYNEIQAVALPLLLLLFQHVSASCLGVFFFVWFCQSVIFHCITLAVRTVLCRYQVFRLWNMYLMLCYV